MTCGLHAHTPLRMCRPGHRMPLDGERPVIVHDVANLNLTQQRERFLHTDTTRIGL